MSRGHNHSCVRLSKITILVTNKSISELMSDRDIVCTSAKIDPDPTHVVCVQTLKTTHSPFNLIKVDSRDVEELRRFSFGVARYTVIVEREGFTTLAYEDHMGDRLQSPVTVKKDSPVGRFLCAAPRTHLHGSDEFHSTISVVGVVGLNVTWTKNDKLD